MCILLCFRGGTFYTQTSWAIFSASTFETAGSPCILACLLAMAIGRRRFCGLRHALNRCSSHSSAQIRWPASSLPWILPAPLAIFFGFRNSPFCAFLLAFGVHVKPNEEFYPCHVWFASFLVCFGPLCVTQNNANKNNLFGLTLAPG